MTGAASGPKTGWERLAPQLGLYAMLGVCFAAALAGHWRRGSIGIGACFVVAAAMRWFMPARDVPLLVNRGRAFDVTVLAALGGATITLAVWIPFSRPF